MSTKSVELVPQHLLMTNVVIRHLSLDNSWLLLSEVFIIQSLVYISWYQLWTFDHVYSHKYTVGLFAKKNLTKNLILHQYCIKHLPPTRPNIRTTIPNVMLKIHVRFSATVMLVTLWCWWLTLGDNLRMLATEPCRQILVTSFGC